MSYTPDLSAAAGRHLDAAEALAEGPRRRVAGYLNGVAAECAIKAMMRDAGLIPQGPRREDPFYAHFPQLRTMMRDRLKGRRGGPLLKFINDDRFMTRWDTDMRYCKGSEIQDSWISAWQTQARDAVAAIGT